MILEETHRIFAVVSYWLQPLSLKLSRPAIILISIASRVFLLYVSPAYVS
jgi:hypothetical protein